MNGTGRRTIKGEEREYLSWLALGRAAALLVREYVEEVKGRRDEEKEEEEKWPKWRCTERMMMTKAVKRRGGRKVGDRGKYLRRSTEYCTAARGVLKLCEVAEMYCFCAKFNSLSKENKRKHLTKQ